MRIRRSGFALIAVILSVAAVFALTMYGALVLRAELTETNALSSRSRDSVVAHSGAVVALSGLLARPQDGTTRDAQSLDEFGGLAAGSPAGSTGQSGGDSAAAPELPAFLIALLGEVGQEIEQATRTSGVGQSATASVSAEELAQTSRRDLGSVERLKEIGIPAVPLEVRIGNQLVRVALSDSLGKLNINNVSAQQLMAYLDAIGLTNDQAETLTNQMLDWIDTDQIPRPGSFERTVYAERGLVPADSSIRYLDELRFLPAMTDRVMQSLRRNFSIGSAGRLYIYTASRESLRAIGLTDRQIDRILELRSIGELNESALRRIVVFDASPWRDVITLDPSPLLEVRVEVYPVGLETTVSSPSSVFEGVALLSANGVRDIALKPEGG